MESYTADDIEVNLVTSWTDISNSLPYVAMINIFCRSFLMSDPASQYWSESTNLRDQLDRRFSEEFTLKSPKDFLIRYDITVEGPPFSTRMMIRFKSEQAFALFKMKYYA